MKGLDWLRLAEEHFQKLDRELEIAIKEQRHVAGMLRDAQERTLRLTIAKNNAFGEREMERAALKRATPTAHDQSAQGELPQGVGAQGTLSSHNREGGT